MKTKDPASLSFGRLTSLSLVPGSGKNGAHGHNSYPTAHRAAARLTVNMDERLKTLIGVIYHELLV